MATTAIITTADRVISVRHSALAEVIGERHASAYLLVMCIRAAFDEWNETCLRRDRRAFERRLTAGALDSARVKYNRRSDAVYNFSTRGAGRTWASYLLKRANMMMWNQEFIEPSADDIECGSCYIFHVSLASSDFPGRILARADEPHADHPNADDPTWRYTTEPCRNAWSPVNLFGKPAFVLLDREGQEVVRVRRMKRIPTRFGIIQKGEIVGEIRRRGIVTYRISLKDGPSWVFQMRVFRQHFCAASSANQRAWVRVWCCEEQWLVLVQPEADDLRLIASLAFIHRERCAYQ
jgi:hypothetical protein